jgi:hypothetical protein
MRIVDQAFPAGRGARLFEIDAHDDEQRVSDFVRRFFQPLSIVHGCRWIVNRTGSDHDHQAMVTSIKDALQGMAALKYGLFGFLGQRNAALDLVGIEQNVLRGDVHVVNQFFVHARVPVRGSVF